MNAINEEGMDLIKLSEGLRLKAYKCPAGVWTIGYGTTKDVVEGMVITEEKAEELLQIDVVDFEFQVSKAVTVPLNNNQFSALVSFTYNLGGGNLRSSTLLRLLNSGDYEGAAGQFVRWNRAGGRVLKGLTTRRVAESRLFSKPS